MCDVRHRLPLAPPAANSINTIQPFGGGGGGGGGGGISRPLIFMQIYENKYISTERGNIGFQ